jgi:hypothetical protein
MLWAQIIVLILFVLWFLHALHNISIYRGLISIRDLAIDYLFVIIFFVVIGALLVFAGTFSEIIQ